MVIKPPTAFTCRSKHSLMDTIVTCVLQCVGQPSLCILIRLYWTFSLCRPLQTVGQMSRSIQSPVSLRGVAHSYSSAQLQNAAAAAAAMVNRPVKHPAARPLQQGSKGGATGSGGGSNQVHMAAWRKQSGGNTGRTLLRYRPRTLVYTTSTIRASISRFYPKRLTMRTFVRRKRNNILLAVQ